MGRVILIVVMSAEERRRSEKQIEKDLMEVPGVVDVDTSLEAWDVTIIGSADDAATLKARVEARLGKPVKILADLPVAPASPAGGDGAMRPPLPVPWYPHPAPPLGPYVGYHMPTDAPASTFQDEYHHCCSCSIQ